MIATLDVHVDLAAIITACVGLLVVLGTPAVLSARRAGRAERAVGRAEIAATATQLDVENVVEQVRPENGRRLGEVAQATNRLLEVVDGRVHDISKRVDAQGRDLSEIRRHVSGVEAQQIAQGEAVEAVSDKLTRHLEEVTPLIQEHIAKEERGKA